MRVVSLALIWLLLTGISAARKLKAEEQVVLDKARERARAYVADLPDFIASETITRSVLTSGKWRDIDTMETVLSYEHGRGEKIRLVSINGHPPESPNHDARGATTIGMVSSQLTSPFRPEANTTFEYIGRDRYRDRNCLVFSYVVPRRNSDYELTIATPTHLRQSAVVPFSGRIWIERDSGYALRVEKVAEGIPEDFPITDAEAIVEYDWVVIGENRFWLPKRAESLTGYAPDPTGKHKILDPVKREVYLNITRFHDYRKFEADVKMVD